MDASFTTLQPLCEATNQALRAVRLLEDDRLFVKLDDSAEHFIVQAASVKTYKDHDGVTRHYPASQSALFQWTRKIPERTELGSGRWKFAATDYTALIIQHTWKPEQIVWESKEAETVYRFLLTRLLIQNHSALVAAKFKMNREVPEMPSDFTDHPEMPLADYQKAALVAGLSQETYALFMQQGTGKTPTTIARICLEASRTRRGLMGDSHMMRVLIICPKQVRSNWQNEIERFAVVPGKVGVLRGGQLKRVQHLVDVIRDDDECAFGAAICSYTSIDRSWDALSMVPWDLVILDESHYIKHGRTQRAKSVHKLINHSERRMILTGTPITNNVFDLWSQLEFLDKGLSGFSNFNRFRKFYGSFVKREKKHAGDPGEVLTGIKHMPLIQERLARLSFTITKKDARMGLPDKVYDTYEVEMTKKQARYYADLQRQLALEIEDQLSGDVNQLTVENVLTKLLRLSQITSGHIRWDGEDGTSRPAEQIDTVNPKVDALVEMIREDRRNDPYSKTIVWATYIEDIRVICERLQQEGIKFVSYHKAVPAELRVQDAEQAAERFNKDPEFSVFVGNPASAGEGLNLVGYDYKDPDGYETNCDHEIFFSQNWSAVQRSQSEDRAHRRGTRNKVRITDLVVPGSIDEEIRVRVTNKRKSAMQIQDLRKILSTVLEDLELDD